MIHLRSLRLKKFPFLLDFEYLYDENAIIRWTVLYIYLVHIIIVVMTWYNVRCGIIVAVRNEWKSIDVIG